MSIQYKLLFKLLEHNYNMTSAGVCKHDTDVYICCILSHGHHLITDSSLMNRIFKFLQIFCLVCKQMNWSIVYGLFAKSIFCAILRRGHISNSLSRLLNLYFTHLCLLSNSLIIKLRRLRETLLSLSRSLGDFAEVLDAPNVPQLLSSYR